MFVSFKCIQYPTWCQNRGCICMSSTRRTYRSNPHPSCIILQSRIFQEEGKRNSSATSQSSTSIDSAYYYKSSSSNSTVFPHKELHSTHRINSSTRNLPEILQLQDSFQAGRYQGLCSNCSPCIQAFYMAETLLVTL